jgi:hypothetical protein
MKYQLCIILSLVLFSTSYGQQSKWPTEKNKNQVKSLMHKFWGHIEVLRPYMGNSDEFKNPKNEAIITEHLRELSRLARTAKHQKLLNSPNFSFSRKVLENHISDVERTFKIGNKDYARWMLNSTTSICMSCHTQFPTDPGTVSVPDTGTGTTYFDAEFLFATRRYESAANVYRKIISDYPGNKLKANELEAAVRRLVAFHARIKRDPKAGAEELQGVLKNKNLPEYLKRDTEAWLALFEKWKVETDIDPKKATPQELTQWVEQKFEKTLWDKMVASNDPRVVTYLRVSGILYEYLQAHPKNEITARVLYWLARSEYRLNSNFFYSLGDLYLKECMRNYSKDPYAKKCYFEYEDNMVMSYTGSRGTYLPLDVQKELKELKALVGLKPGDKNLE